MISELIRLSHLHDDIRSFREKLLNEFPESFMTDPDLADRVMVAREALYYLYDDFDTWLWQRYSALSEQE